MHPGVVIGYLEARGRKRSLTIKGQGMVAVYHMSTSQGVIKKVNLGAHLVSFSSFSHTSPRPPCRISVSTLFAMDSVSTKSILHGQIPPPVEWTHHSPTWANNRHDLLARGLEILLVTPLLSAACRTMNNHSIGQYKESLRRVLPPLTDAISQTLRQPSPTGHTTLQSSPVHSCVVLKRPLRWQSV